MSCGPECMCPRCLMADMDAHLAANGIDAGQYAVEADAAPERTRYATPGAACGRGRVQRASDAQVRFIKRLMGERDTRSLVRLPGSEDVDNMSKRGASDLIERLRACPVKADAPKADAPSEKALAYALSLVERKGVALVGDEVRKLNRAQLSRTIDMLKSLPDAAPKADTPEVTEGMYRNPETGEVFKVQRAVHGSGNLYAKLLTVVDGEGTFAYAAGAIRKIKPEWRMTLEQAKEFGTLYGVCCVCSATLEKEESIAAGIGPVCATKF